MISLWWAVAAFTALAPVSAARGQDAFQFDIVCKGEQSTVKAGQRPETKPFEDRLSVDLNRSIWCYTGGSCGKTLNRVSASPLDMDMNPAKEPGSFAIDRMSGGYKRSVLLKDDLPFSLKKRTGECNKAPYTAIVDPKF